jgi:hypothetical protein
VLRQFSTYTMIFGRKRERHHNFRHTSQQVQKKKKKKKNQLTNLIEPVAHLIIFHMIQSFVFGDKLSELPSILSLLTKHFIDALTMLIHLPTTKLEKNKYYATQSFIKGLIKHTLVVLAMFGQSHQYI